MRPDLGKTVAPPEFMGLPCSAHRFDRADVGIPYGCGRRRRGETHASRGTGDWIQNPTLSDIPLVLFNEF